MEHLLLIGAGYSAAYIAEKFLTDPASNEMTVTVTTRAASQEKKRIKPFPQATKLLEVDYQSPSLPVSTTHLIMTAPVSVEKNREQWQALAKAIGQLPSLQWIGYLSTTSVYGDAAGEWVTEDFPLNPSNKRADDRLHAETQWQSLSKELSLPLDIFRLTGIYGPGRSAIDKLRSGKARMIIKKDQVFNRIHVADIAEVCFAAAQTPRQSLQQSLRRIYNVSDGQPCPPQEVTKFAADLLGIAPPKAENYESADMSFMARSFYEENKRIDNRKMRTELNVNLRYPSYKEGLTPLA
ncbi:SDR family oxidoreductase [Temperatibacter marinus]|uniref:SDR family oxidoreductase n=1 Tax=Temperatibacter marinus TaxID=1456591 RepID=A0AA52EDR7_9PROT|nr:SDR family oxidoreductase [Temperatibacter marinus]WND03602.1 SDR family oxidoreductase [Temperatibacter marinus]